ncbi:MAG: type IV pilin protein [Hydrogenophaga sp.]|uniref:type IV pilin protein n=1 Tax=Hydrogenophaga sp. TaxID=1904254 RepID=UPI003D1507BF
MKVRGFTLIEVTIVVALIAVLTVIALPNYNQYVLRSHRAHARAALMRLAQWMEREATVRGSYPLAIEVPAGVLGVEGGRYTLSVSSETGWSHRLSALPTGAQTADPCGSFHLDHTGQRSQGATAQVPEPLDARSCWER